MSLVGPNGRPVWTSARSFGPSAHHNPVLMQHRRNPTADLPVAATPVGPGSALRASSQIGIVRVDVRLFARCVQRLRDVSGIIVGVSTASLAFGTVLLPAEAVVFLLWTALAYTLHCAAYDVYDIANVRQKFRSCEGADPLPCLTVRAAWRARAVRAVRGMLDVAWLVWLSFRLPLILSADLQLRMDPLAAEELRCNDMGASCTLADYLASDVAEAKRGAYTLIFLISIINVACRCYFSILDARAADLVQLSATARRRLTRCLAASRGLSEESARWHNCELAMVLLSEETDVSSRFVYGLNRRGVYVEFVDSLVTDDTHDNAQQHAPAVPQSGVSWAGRTHTGLASAHPPVSGSGPKRKKRHRALTFWGWVWDRVTCILCCCVCVLCRQRRQRCMTRATRCCPCLAPCCCCSQPKDLPAERLPAAQIVSQRTVVTQQRPGPSATPTTQRTDGHPSAQDAAHSGADMQGASGVLEFRADAFVFWRQLVNAMHMAIDAAATAGLVSIFGLHLVTSVLFVCWNALLYVHHKEMFNLFDSSHVLMKLRVFPHRPFAGLRYLTCHGGLAWRKRMARCSVFIVFGVPLFHFLPLLYNHLTNLLWPGSGNTSAALSHAEVLALRDRGCAVGDGLPALGSSAESAALPDQVCDLSGLDTYLDALDYWVSAQQLLFIGGVLAAIDILFLLFRRLAVAQLTLTPPAARQLALFYASVYDVPPALALHCWSREQLAVLLTSEWRALVVRDLARLGIATRITTGVLPPPTHTPPASAQTRQTSDNAPISPPARLAPHPPVSGGAFPGLLPPLPPRDVARDPAHRPDMSEPPCAPGAHSAGAATPGPLAANSLHIPLPSRPGEAATPLERPHRLRLGLPHTPQRHLPPCTPTGTVCATPGGPCPSPGPAATPGGALTHPGANERPASVPLSFLPPGSRLLVDLQQQQETHALAAGVGPLSGAMAEAVRLEEAARSSPHSNRSRGVARSFTSRLRLTTPRATNPPPPVQPAVQWAMSGGPEAGGGGGDEDELPPDVPFTPFAAVVSAGDAAPVWQLGLPEPTSGAQGAEGQALQSGFDHSPAAGSAVGGGSPGSTVSLRKGRKNRAGPEDLGPVRASHQVACSAGSRRGHPPPALRPEVNSGSFTPRAAPGHVALQLDTPPATRHVPGDATSRAHV